VAIAERNQRYFGVWGTVGSTGRWPEVVNMWELDGWDGLADNFAHELSHSSLQDPSLAEWWAAAAELRRGGFDRIVVPAPYTRTVDQLVADGVKGMTYAHELFEAPPGTSAQLLEALPELARPAVERLGMDLVGAFEVAMVLEAEAIAIWSIPDWATWVRYEAAWSPDGPLGPWRSWLLEHGVTMRRTLMVDAPLSPMRIGRQPSVDDRRPLSEI
jgi:hypothetical protein